MLRAFVLFTVIVSITAGAVSAQQVTVKASKFVRVRGNVLAVEEGDRVKLAADDGNVYSATLQSIDAPDQDQEYFKKARKRLAELIEGKEVTVMMRTAENGETYAVIFAGSDDVGLKLIQEGLAWFAPNRSTAQSTSDRDKYILAETAAKAAKQGLWDEKDPVAPWTLRGEKVEPQITEVSETTSTATVPETKRRTPPVPGRTYILGPRGGCYYLNDQGIKVYVRDKTLCQKP
jgi:endonuclease YncB( thermonuclease family)